MCICLCVQTGPSHRTQAYWGRPALRTRLAGSPANPVPGQAPSQVLGSGLPIFTGHPATPNTSRCFPGQLPGNRPLPQGPRLEEPDLTLTAALRCTDPGAGVLCPRKVSRRNRDLSQHFNYLRSHSSTFPDTIWPSCFYSGCLFGLHSAGPQDMARRQKGRDVST